MNRFNTSKKSGRNMSYKIQTKAEFEQFATESWDEINDFLCSISKELPIPFYSSVDIRESVTRFAPVDNNLYPAGFNNICMLDQNIAVDRIKQEIFKTNPGIKKVAILTESHTKNLFYLDHLHALKTIVERAGFETNVITLDEDLMEGKDALQLKSKSEYDITISLAKVIDNKFTVAGEEIEYVILNNDQSNPINLDWAAIETPVKPPAQMGWFYRKKTEHFRHYHDACQKFCDHFSVDPYLIQARFRIVNDIDFLEKAGLEQLSDQVKELQSEMTDSKKVFIKANQGTYGMGIMTADSPEEVLNMNRKIRNKMDIGKNKKKFDSVIIQEGIQTAITHDGNPAEITIYLVGGRSVGGFMRSNPLKDSESNLNSRGMVYQKFCISEIHQGHDHKAKEAVYSIIARISTIAASYEITDALK